MVITSLWDKINANDSKQYIKFRDAIIFNPFDLKLLDFKINRISKPAKIIGSEARK